MSQIALYRKYRSVDFDDLMGQDHITKTLKNAVAKGNFAHAYLFYGPRGTGKTSAARILAKAINCEHNKDGNPDNKCDKCKVIDDGRVVDIIEIDAASHTQVDNIREVIIERAKFAPTILSYKVYIIDEAHMLSKSSFNALLKTLEEPPEHTVFILATTEMSKIIPTIQSRCQRFDFHRITEKVIIGRLRYIATKEKISISESALSLIATASEGGFRDAISLLDQVADSTKGEIDSTSVESLLGIADRAVVLDYVYAITKKDTAKALELLSLAIENGYEPNQILKDIVDVLRRLLIAASSNIGEIGLSESSTKIFAEILKDTSTTELVRILDTYIKNDALYKHSGLFQLSLEVATVKTCLGLVEESGKESSEDVKVDKSRESVVAKKAPSNLDDSGKWQHFLLEVKSKNNSIHAVLKVCEPIFNEKEITLAFPYKFHKERIEDVRNRQVVEDMLYKVYGNKYKVKCTLRPGSQAPSNQVSTRESKDDLLDEAINIFGGEVVE